MTETERDTTMEQHRKVASVFHTSLLCLLLIVISAPLFSHMIAYGTCWGDILVHNTKIRRGITDGVWPVHLLYHVTVLAASRLMGWGDGVRALGQASVFVLALCVAAKAYITNDLLLRVKLSRRSLSLIQKLGMSPTTFITLLTFGLVTMAPIVINPNRMFIGQLPPTCWHSPTLIIAAPFGILLFYYGYRLLDQARLSSSILVGLLAAINVVAKPNYFMAFLPVFLLFALYRHRLSQATALAVLSMIPGIIVLGIQYLYRFARAEESSVIFAPFLVWRGNLQWHTWLIPLSLLASLAFPLVYWALYRKALVHKRMLALAWGVLLSSVCWAALFAETGSTLYHGNFFWGTKIATYILMLVTMLDFLTVSTPARATDGTARRRFDRYNVVWLIVVAHFASGIAYLLKVTLWHSCY